MITHYIVNRVIIISVRRPEVKKKGENGKSSDCKIKKANASHCSQNKGKIGQQRFFCVGQKVDKVIGIICSYMVKVILGNLIITVASRKGSAESSAPRERAH